MKHAIKSKLTYYTTIIFITALLFISCSKDSPSTEPQNMCLVASNTFNVDGNKLAQFATTAYAPDSLENTITIHAYSTYGSYNKYMFLTFAGTSLPKPGTYTGSDQMVNRKLKANEVWMQYWGDMYDIRGPQSTCTVHVTESNGRLTITFCNTVFSAVFSTAKYNCNASIDVLR
ncbi:MAG: hypothetical protein J0I41_21710 [Filimonas sp.]|nr:hypothetical protein [Filimonas sp.]